MMHSILGYALFVCVPFLGAFGLWSIITTSQAKSGASSVLTAITGLSVGILMAIFYIELLITLFELRVI